VIDKLLDHFRGENVAVACVYCDFQDQERQTAANMMGAITKQVVNVLEIVPTEIEEAFGRAEREVGGRGVQVSERAKLLRAALTSMRWTFICIDALDECSDKHLPQLLTSLRTVSQESPGVRIFVTGRPHMQGAVEKFIPGGIQIIRISPKSEDIKEYVEMELSNDLDSGAMNPALKTDILKGILEKMPDGYVMDNYISKAQSNR